LLVRLGNAQPPVMFSVCSSDRISNFVICLCSEG
jgi:hypothetical protein